MTWLVDTNIISEVRRGSRCHPNVAAWWATVDDRDLFLSVLTLGEIRKGAEAVRPRDPSRAAALQAWLAEITAAFGQRVLPIDMQVADTWGRITAVRTVPTVDALLAATALVHDLSLVTRNTGDVEGLGCRVQNPFVARRHKA